MKIKFLCATRGLFLILFNNLLEDHQLLVVNIIIFGYPKKVKIYLIFQQSNFL